MHTSGMTEPTDDPGMLVGERCSYILTFYEGNTIFDFD